jgi:hypothetical protein
MASMPSRHPEIQDEPFPFGYPMMARSVDSVKAQGNRGRGFALELPQPPLPDSTAIDSTNWP